MPNGYYTEETLPEVYRREDYEAFAAWVRATYLSRYMSQTRDYERAQAWLKDTIESPQVFDYWQRIVKPAGAPTRGAYGLLAPMEYNRRMADYIERNVASGIWTEAQGAAEGQKAISYIAEHGVTLEAPFYYSLEQQAAPFTGAAARADPFRYGRVPTPEGGERGVTEEEYKRMIAPTGAPFVGITTGPLAFPATRGAGKPAGTREYQAAMQRALPRLPSARGMLEEALGGESPAMRQFFMAQFPYLMEMFGGEARRIAPQIAYRKQQAELARLGAKRRGQQWVLGKKAEYLTQGQPFVESYEATQRKIASLRRRAATLRGRAEPRDPWEAYLEQYPFLEKFIRVPPQQRGFYPARFMPMTRWL